MTETKPPYLSHDDTQWVWASFAYRDRDYSWAVARTVDGVVLHMKGADDTAKVKDPELLAACLLAASQHDPPGLTAREKLIADEKRLRAGRSPAAPVQDGESR